MDNSIVKVEFYFKVGLRVSMFFEKEQNSLAEHTKWGGKSQIANYKVFLI